MSKETNQQRRGKEAAVGVSECEEGLQPEEEDTCVSYEKEDTCVSASARRDCSLRRRIHVCHMRRRIHVCQRVRGGSAA